MAKPSQSSWTIEPGWALSIVQDSSKYHLRLKEILTELESECEFMLSLPDDGVSILNYGNLEYVQEQ